MKFLKQRWVIASLSVLTLTIIGYFSYPFLLRGYVDYIVYKYTSGLPKSDRAELYLLDGLSFDQKERLTTGFPIRGYGDALSRIIESRNLNHEETVTLSDLWRSQTFGWDYQSLCHDPVYGVRFYSGSKLLFETSICFSCSNFYIINSSVDMGWWGFDTSKPEAKALLDYCSSLIPIEKRLR